jgi:hypothetical protein
MKIEFSVLDEHQAVAIEVEGRVTAADVQAMRRRSVEIAQQTGHRNFIVDIRRLISIDDGSAFSAYELGEQFKDSGFSVWTNTAVLMPEDPRAREQAEFMHTVEVNRGRGILSYVESYDEAFTWFDDMARRG